MNWRIVTGPNSDGLSIRYCRLGAVNSSGDDPACSCVATCHCAPGGCTNVTVAGRSSSPRAHMIAAGMLMCACVVSTAEIRAVDAVAVDLVLHRHAAAVAADGPPVRIRPRRRQLPAVGGERVHVVDVLREVVQRVAARRRRGSCAARAAPIRAR